MNMGRFLSLCDRMPTSIARKFWNCDCAAGDRFRKGRIRVLDQATPCENDERASKGGPPLGHLSRRSLLLIDVGESSKVHWHVSAQCSQAKWRPTRYSVSQDCAEDMAVSSIVAIFVRRSGTDGPLCQPHERRNSKSSAKLTFSAVAILRIESRVGFASPRSI